MAKPKLIKRGNTLYRNGKAVKPGFKNGSQVSYSTNYNFAGFDGK